MVVVFQNRRKFRQMMPYVTATLMVTMAFFLCLITFPLSPFEVFAVVTRDERRYCAARGVEQHDAELVIGDEDAPVTVDAQAVRFAIVFGDDVEFALW